MRYKKMKKFMLILCIVYSICTTLYIILQKEHEVELKLVAVVDHSPFPQPPFSYYDVWWTNIRNIEKAEYYQELQLIKFAEKWNFEKDGFLVVSWGREITTLSYKTSSMKKYEEGKRYMGRPVFCGNADISTKIYIYCMPKQPDLRLYTAWDYDLEYKYDGVELDIDRH